MQLAPLRSGHFAPGGVSTPSGFTRPRRDVGGGAGGGASGLGTPRGAGMGIGMGIGIGTDTPPGLPRTGAVSSRGGGLYKLNPVVTHSLKVPGFNP
jgi:hypothetical protein